MVGVDGTVRWALWGAHPFAERVDETGPHEPGALALVKDTPPAWLRRVIERGLSVAPSNRWPSMDELAAALTRDPVRRRRAIAATAAGIAVCVAAGIGAARLVDGRRAVCAGGPPRIAGVWELGPEGQSPRARRQEL